MLSVAALALLGAHVALAADSPALRAEGGIPRTLLDRSPSRWNQGALDVKLGAPELTLSGGSGDVRALTAQDVEGVVRKHVGVIKACYQKSLLRTPSLQGQVVIELRIDNAGAVSSSRIRKTTLRHAETEACLVRLVQRMKFPRNEGGAVVRYPFFFQTPGR